MAMERYLPPIAPDASFQISRAFGGSFRHTDEQNKYAVDTAMPIGTPVYAARGGLAMEVDNDFLKAGLAKPIAQKPIASGFCTMMAPWRFMPFWKKIELRSIRA